MHVIYARNVNDALPKGIALLLAEGIQRTSRNGSIIEVREPVTTVYAKPMERVLFGHQRNANPFFHLYESVWMLAGRNDVAPLSKIVKRMDVFSDDGRTLRGSYGYRWRNHFGQDNLEKIIEQFREAPDTRRAYLPMWDGHQDGMRSARTGKNSDDEPCNVGVAFLLRDDLLNMTVFNRSNDVIWGAYGANVVHMSYLQEYIADRLGVDVGTYSQVSNSFHVYENNPTWQTLAATFPRRNWMPLKAPYSSSFMPKSDCSPSALCADAPEFDTDLQNLADPMETGRYASDWFNTTLEPMMFAWRLAKDRQWDAAYTALERMYSYSDWRLAAKEWIDNRRIEYTKRTGE